ncbi:MAG: histidine--tRNA ligase [Erysipelotrichaceae bacterium]|nr:histidine--tRNA ligase [Erysipelotrichaceae bacterium]
MAERYQVPRGTQDIYGSDMNKWKQVEERIRHIAEKYGYKEIRTPVFEATEVFAGENDSSDMVNKEMYTFTDNGNRSLTLRPEGTKGIIRSFVEHKMYGNSADFPIKLYYIGPMFRYDRPQKGRYRQFHQFGIEAIGVKSPLLDVESIALGYEITKSFGIENVRILINTLGDTESRMNYRNALKKHFEPYLGELCEDCKRRYQQNPLRILDCKVDVGHPSFESAPMIQDYLNEASREYFDKVLKGLDDLGIPYQIQPRLVRGLDYYTNTVYEAVPYDDEGQQATVYGGGQYDGLVESFGGGDLCGVGFGMGIERLITLATEKGNLQVEEETTDVYVISLGDVGTYASRITAKLREAGYKAEMDYQNRSLKAQFKSCDRLGVKAIVIVGSDEVANNTLQLKDTVNKTQETIGFDEVVERVGNILK